MTMLVSLLQLMGFPAAKPVHSRAEEEAMPDTVKTVKASRAKPVGHAQSAVPVQEHPARRSPVKAQAVKSKATAKKVVVAVKPVKAASPAVKTTVAPKATAKPLTTKTPAKKTVVKPVAKVVVKATKTTTIAKATPAPAANKAAAAKPLKSTQSTTKATPAQPAVVTQTAKAAPVKVAKPIASLSKTKSESVPIQTPVVPKQAAPAKPAAKSTPEFQMTPSGVPIRTGRPSSRLVQLTVPSMAQAVASTAAKSSFTQMATIHQIVPPLASATKRDPKLANNWKSKAVDKLTDDEVIAMSDNDYMNDTQLAFFRLKLVTLKNEILSNAGETTEHLREDTVVVPDPADRATIEEEHALELRTRDRERKLLKKIEQSINRIDAGDYGFCDETGEPIGVGRLLARPTATLSLEAQQRRELKQKMFGD